VSVTKMNSKGFPASLMNVTDNYK